MLETCSVVSLSAGEWSLMMLQMLPLPCDCLRARVLSQIGQHLSFQPTAISRQLTPAGIESCDLAGWIWMLVLSQVRKSGPWGTQLCARTTGLVSFCAAHPSRYGRDEWGRERMWHDGPFALSLIHISEPTRQAEISYA